MTPDEELDQIYSKIPGGFQCVPGCHECCGPVLVNKLEFERMGSKRGPLGPKLECPYRDEQGCSVYENRPFPCRLFGVSVEHRMSCPHGGKALVRLSQRKTDQLNKRYERLCRKVGNFVPLFEIDLEKLKNK